jgi:NADH dehydrogenase
LTPPRTITVFGGTGFLGRWVVHDLVDRGFSVRIASRHPEPGRTLRQSGDAEVESVHADVNDDASVASAVAGAYGVVNAVSLYVEHGKQSFHVVHVEAAERVATHSRQRGVDKLVHISGIGADDQSGSRYIRSRGMGESIVRRAFPAATIIRPAVMFGLQDAFLGPIANLLRRLPVFPMFGRGQTNLQPAYVEDVAQAVGRVLESSEARMTYELGGPHTYTYENLLRTIAHHLHVKRILFPVPFALWQAMAFAAELLPNPPVTRNQVELMKIDNVAAAEMPGFSTLFIESRSVEEVLPRIIRPS